MSERNRLSVQKVNKPLTPGRYGDGGGLWLQVKPGGSKSWLLRYMHKGRARAMGLGPVELVGLAEVRDRAREARKLLLDGVDPIEARRRQRQAGETTAARATTFADAVERYLASHERSWRNEKHRAQWRATLATYALPELGALSLSDIDTPLVLKVLSSIWSQKPETASRLRGRIEAVLAWGIAQGLRPGPNPAQWKNHLAKLLPPRARMAPVKHHAAMPYGELPDFMAKLSGHEGISALALRFTIFTAARTGEAIGARWSEIDGEARIWTVPGPRMKAGRPHRVPLSDRAVEILAALPRIADCDYLFPGASAGRHLSNMAMLELTRGLCPGYVPHGFRSTFKDWATETTSHPREAVELALAHRVGDAVERAYLRGDLFQKRRALMDDWADFCCGPC